MDLLSEVLQAIEVEATAFVNFHMKAPWGLEIRDTDDFSLAYCYCLIDGAAVASTAGLPPVSLGPGDMLVLPMGGASTIASSAQARTTQISAIWHGHDLPDLSAGQEGGPAAHIHLGGDGPATHVLALAFRFRGRRYDRLLSALPRTLVLRTGQRATVPFLRAALDFLSEDRDSDLPGYRAVANELAELLFIFMLREAIIQNARHEGNWLHALFDKRIGKALLAIHQRPHHPWRVDTLATEAGMSRSAFVERFSAAVGQAPFDYLTDWRVACAEEALRQGDQPIAAIMDTVGYQSESAFRKAFAKKTGMTPGRYRKATASKKK